MVQKVSRKKRLAKYGAAAVAVAAGGMMAADASAEIVTLDTSGIPLNSSASNELFVDILGFATGASSFNIQYTNNAFSGYNPFSNSEIMVRGFGNTASRPGFAQVRAQQGGGSLGMAAFSTNLSAPYSGLYYNFVRNVGAIGNLPTGTNGTFLTGTSSPGNNNFLAWGTYAPGKGDWNPAGGNGIAYFRFINSQTGQAHDAWLDITTSVNGAGDFQAAINSITVDTGVIPEPTGVGLLCMGAAGIAAFRRRRKSA